MNDLLVSITLTRVDGTLEMTYQGMADSNMTWISPATASNIICGEHILSGFQYTPKLEN